MNEDLKHILNICYRTARRRRIDEDIDKVLKCLTRINYVISCDQDLAGNSICTFRYNKESLTKFGPIMKYISFKDLQEELRL